MIKNLTSKKIVSKTAKPPGNYLDRVLGMILPRNSGGLILKTRFGIHTLFMKQSIDVIIIDKSKKVVKIKKNLTPLSVFIWNPKFGTVIELKKGSIVASKTKPGDYLSFRTYLP